MTQPWPDLGALAEVGAAVETVRAAVSALRRHPSNRRGARATAAAAAARAARASAAIDGSESALQNVQVLTVDPVLDGALRVAVELPRLVPVWRRAPLQALARLDVLAGAAGADNYALGRPEHAGAEVGARLATLAQVVVSGPWPAPVMSAVVHGELLALRPFGPRSGVVARAAGRLETMADGLDPAGLGVPEVAFLRLGPRYADHAARFAQATEEGVRSWILLVCRALDRRCARGRGRSPKRPPAPRVRGRADARASAAAGLVRIDASA